MSSVSASLTAADAVVADAAAPAPPVARPLRLLLLTDTSIQSTGGSECFLRNLLAGLPAARYQITLVQLATSPAAASAHGPVRAMQPSCPNIQVMPIGAVYGPRGWHALLKLSRMLRRERFDIVQSQHEKSDLLNALLPRRFGAIHISNRRDMGFNKSARLRTAFRAIANRFNSVVAPAEPILADLARAEGIDARSATCIPNGVDSARFQPASVQTRREARRRLGVGDGFLLFGCVGRLTEVKRHIDLIEAFASVHRRQSRSRLVLIGDGPLRASLQQRVNALGLGGAVCLPGDMGALETILPALDVMVLASSTEGMSNAILEAMASGLPVVATAVGGTPRLVGHRVTGLLVSPMAPALLADAMLELASSPVMRKTMGAAGRDRVEHEFSLEAMVQSYDRLYQRLASPAARP